MSEDTIPMFESLPMDNPDALKKVQKIRNNLQEQFIELINRDNVSLADVQKATGIPWGTLYGWYKGDVTTQLADENLLRLARFFNVSLEFLLFGLGDDTPAFEKLA